MTPIDPPQRGAAGRPHPGEAPDDGPGSDEYPTHAPRGDTGDTPHPGTRPSAESEHDMPTAAEEPRDITSFASLGAEVSVPGYDMKGMLGEGGMGAVYLAEQHKPRRTVALKVIRPDRVSKTALARFDYEAEVLASLHHPGIAQVFEVGRFPIADATAPYFAMEYIPGARTLTRYAKAKSLGIRERLELFVGVCDAVRHGHQRGIIHRDLKPANILVDNTGAPRIIDFGVARAAGPQHSGRSMRTDIGELVGTLQYMSPEQCLAEEAADVRSDVYALGAVLYELLADDHPYDVSTMGLAEAIRTVTERTTPPLSQKRPDLTGDLTVIVSKAMEKDREARYQTVSELAADVRRHLSDQPILARPAGPVLIFRKWVKRNQQLAATLGTAAFVLIGVSAVLITGIVRAERRASSNLDLAETNLAASRESVELVREMLDFESPEGRDRMQRGMVDVEDLLDSAADSVAATPPALPDTEAAFRELLGVGYISVRSSQKAAAQLERVVAIRRQQAEGGPTPELAEAIHALARARYFAADLDLALPLYTESLEIRRALHPGDHAQTALSLTHLAATEQRLGDLDHATELLSEALAMRQRLHGSDHPDIAASLNNLGSVLLARGQAGRAEQYLRQSLEMITILNGPNTLEVSHASRNLARALQARGELDSSADLYRRCLEIRLAKLKPDDQRVRLAHADFTTIMLAQLERDGRLADARTIREELDAGPVSRVRASDAVARGLMQTGRWTDAATLLDGAIGLAEETGSTNELGSLRVARAACAAELDDFVLAEDLLAASTPRPGDQAAASDHALVVERLVTRLRSAGLDADANRVAALAR